MKFIAWDDNLILQIDLIDEEHRFLIFLMNKLYEQYHKGEPQETVRVAFSELIDYAVKHFKDEEEYMASIKYSDLDAHKAIHKNLLNRLKTYSQEFDNSNGQISEYVFTFLKLWVTSHIKGIDAKIANVS